MLRIASFLLCLSTTLPAGEKTGIDLLDGQTSNGWRNNADNHGHLFCIGDYTEPENVAAQRSPEPKGHVLRPDGGTIALQAHDDTSVSYFRSIRLRRLP